MIDKLITKIIELQNPTCVGLDTDFSYLPDDMRRGVTTFKEAAERIYDFNRAIVDSVCDVVPSVKVQVAYYEKYGVDGVKTFADTVNYAKSKGLYVIADCKRNDIGSTAQCYSSAYLGKTDINGEKLSAFAADMLTINGYLGTDGIAPFLKDIKEYDKGAFVLVKTSNPSSGELQNLKLESGEYLYERMGALVEEWGKDSIGEYGYSDVGAVVGATHPEEAARLRGQLAHTFFLIPGYGAQGGNAQMLKCCFDGRGLGGVVNNSRGIITAYTKPAYEGFGFAEAARAACVAMQKDLSSTIGKMGK